MWHSFYKTDSVGMIERREKKTQQTKARGAVSYVPRHQAHESTHGHHSRAASYTALSPLKVTPSAAGRASDKEPTPPTKVFQIKGAGRGTLSSSNTLAQPGDGTHCGCGHCHHASCPAQLSCPDSLWLFSLIPDPIQEDSWSQRFTNFQSRGPQHLQLSKHPQQMSRSLFTELPGSNT